MFRVLPYIGILLLVLSVTNCAKRGMPQGGPLDSIPPLIVRTIPENFATDFDGEEIQLHFDEFVKLKDLNQQLVVSPPMENPPMVTPHSASKQIRFRFMDSLRENTTYSINFGNSIVDNNEENPYQFLKFVFSTGSHLDSLGITGSIADARLIKPDDNVSVMLYDIDKNFNDSVVYKEKPLYIANTLNHPGVFELENLRPGRYLLVALRDDSNTHTFVPEMDKIGFVDTHIEVPTDSVFHLTLSREVPAYKAEKPVQVSDNQFLFGYKGEADELDIELLSGTPAGFRQMLTRGFGTDTLRYWYRPALETDSARFAVRNGITIDTFAVKIEDMQPDSLEVGAVKSGTLIPGEAFQLTANRPLLSVDPSRISITDRDSLSVVFTDSLDVWHNLLTLDFEKEERQQYNISLFPGAVTDFFSEVNDTVNFRASTRTEADYGFLELTVNNIPAYPIIAQLVKEKGEVVKEAYARSGTDGEGHVFEFEYIPPGKYYARLVYDSNENGIWDTGSFLERRQPEEIVYYPKLLEVRANWSLHETFNIENE